MILIVLKLRQFAAQSIALLSLADLEFQPIWVNSLIVLAVAHCVQPADFNSVRLNRSPAGVKRWEKSGFCLAS
jgi:hypothetical protein